MPPAEPNRDFSRPSLTGSTRRRIYCERRRSGSRSAASAGIVTLQFDASQLVLGAPDLADGVGADREPEVPDVALIDDRLDGRARLRVHRGDAQPAVAVFAGRPDGDFGARCGSRS